jgi:ribosomal protein L11 methylase PrmA
LADSPALDLQFLAAPGPDAFLRERLYALLDDFQPTAIHEDEAGDSWRVFFDSSQQRDAAAGHLALAVAPHLLRTSVLDVPDEDWARRSQQGLTAVTVNRLVIAPPWDIPKTGHRNQEAGDRRRLTGDDRQEAGDLPVIVIEPSMGFGTGHHATTRLCLRLMQQLELRGARVVDIGTGSGVLALAAWKLGATDVVAVDNDPDALENARLNIARNGAGGAIESLREDLSTLRIESADLVLGNLTAAVITHHAATLRRLTKDSGFLILSGFGRDHLIDILPALGAQNLFHDGVEKGWTMAAEEELEGEWAAVMLQRQLRAEA